MVHGSIKKRHMLSTGKKKTTGKKKIHECSHTLLYIEVGVSIGISGITIE